MTGNLMLENRRDLPAASKLGRGGRLHFDLQLLGTRRRV
jgi:hypothetical protein